MKSKNGFTLIELIVVVAIIAIIVAIAIPNLLRARLASNEASAIASLRTLSSAQKVFHSASMADDDDTGEFGSLAQLSNATPPYIDSVLGGGGKWGYRFTITLSVDPDTKKARWEAQADPIVHGQTGNRTFYVDESEIVRGLDIEGEKATRATANPEFGGNYLPISD